MTRISPADESSNSFYEIAERGGEYTSPSSRDRSIALSDIVNTIFEQEVREKLLEVFAVQSLSDVTVGSCFSSIFCRRGPAIRMNSSISVSIEDRIVSPLLSAKNVSLIDPEAVLQKDLSVRVRNIATAFYEQEMSLLELAVRKARKSHSDSIVSEICGAVVQKAIVTFRDQPCGFRFHLFPPKVCKRVVWGHEGPQARTFTIYIGSDRACVTDVLTKLAARKIFSKYREKGRAPGAYSIEHLSNLLQADQVYPLFEYQERDVRRETEKLEQDPARFFSADNFFPCLRGYGHDIDLFSGTSIERHDLRMAEGYRGAFLLPLDLLRERIDEKLRVGRPLTKQDFVSCDEDLFVVGLGIDRVNEYVKEPSLEQDPLVGQMC